MREKMRHQLGPIPMSPPRSIMDGSSRFSPPYRWTLFFPFDSRFKKTALHALWRDPICVLSIGWRTYVGYWNVATMKKSAESDFSFREPPGDELRALLASRFHLSHAAGATTMSAIQYYYLVTGLYYFLILLAPLLSGAAIALRSVRRYAILLRVHISILMAMAMTFETYSVRCFQPISFLMLLILALGAPIALRSVRKDPAIAGGQTNSVETLRADLSTLVQPAFTGS